MEIEQNLSEIKQQFDDVIKYTQNIPDPQTDRLFEIWRECKRDFIEVFNGKYIYERFYKIEFEYRDLAICAIYYDLINSYPEIVKLINLPENICRAIEAKIYDRKGN